MLLDPRTVIAGTTATWLLSVSAYPSDEWALKLGASSAAASFSIEATPDGLGYKLEATATASADFEPGDYRYTLFVEKGAGAGLERHVVEVGDLVVQALVDGSTAVDARNRWQRVLDDLETAYEDFVSTGAFRASYSIGDRSVSFSSLADLQAAIDHARGQVARERRGGKMPKIYTRFRL